MNTVHKRVWPNTVKQIVSYTKYEVSMSNPVPGGGVHR